MCGTMKAMWAMCGAVDVAVRRLREKIEDDPASPKFVVTKRGMGHCFGG